MFSHRIHGFSRLLGLCTVLSLTGAGLTGCAAWFQGESAQAQINIGEDPESQVVASVKTSDQSLGDLSTFINSDQADEMLSTEPLRSRVLALVSRNQDWFKASREVLSPVTQIMQGYILSEGSNVTQDKRSLVIIDSDRNALMVVLIDTLSNTYKILEKVSENRDPQAAAEMQEYADNWALGQLGMAE